PRVPSSPFSQSRSAAGWAAASCAQARSAASERVRMVLCIGGPPGSRKQKNRVASSERQLRQGCSGEGIGQRSAVLGPVHWPGDLEQGADAPPPGFLELGEEPSGAGQGVVAARRRERSPVRGFEPERCPQPTAGKPQGRDALQARAS